MLCRYDVACRPQPALLPGRHGHGQGLVRPAPQHLRRRRPLRAVHAGMVTSLLHVRQCTNKNKNLFIYRIKHGKKKDNTIKRLLTVVDEDKR
jgi:hypothetical protein